MSIAKKCLVADCLTNSRRYNYCQRHAYRFKRYGDPLKLSNELHGMTNLPEYKIWKSIKSRCRKPNSQVYYRYGGRGIDVCDRWYKSFTAFYKDMGARPSSELSIDRINNQGNYEPSNCRWATHGQQMTNRG